MAWGLLNFCSGGPAFTRPEQVPARSDEVLVSSVEYNNKGEAYLQTDPAGKQSYSQTDAAGRPIKQVSSYTGGCPGDDHDLTVMFTYTPDGARATMTAVNLTTDNQTTRYIYGTTLAESEIASSSLLRATILPDSADGSDRMTYAYNRQGQTISMTDQNGTL